MDELAQIAFRVQWLVINADRDSVAGLLSAWDVKFLNDLNQRLTRWPITWKQMAQLERIEQAIADGNEGCPLNQPWLYRLPDDLPDDGPS